MDLDHLHLQGAQGFKLHTHPIRSPESSEAEFPNSNPVVPESIDAFGFVRWNRSGDSKHCIGSGGSLVKF